MGIGSIIVGIASLLFMFGGFLLSWFPVLGTILSFGAPILAIAGIVLGGVGMSRAKRDGQPTGTALAGIIINGVSLIPAILIAVTCGLCNACFTASMMDPQNQNGQWWRDGGAGGFYFGPTPGLDADAGAFAPDPTLPPDPSAPPDPTADPAQPPPAFPPPPIGGGGEPAPSEPAEPGAETPPSPTPP
jgi:hypothetical protein